MAIQRLRHEQTLDEYRKVFDTVAVDEPDLANVVQFAVFHEEVQRWFEWMDAESNPHSVTPATTTP